MKRVVTLVPIFCLFFTNLALAKTKERLSEDNLTRAFAAARKKQVKSIDYDLYFEFEKGKEDFTGKTILKVELNRIDDPLSIDFIGKEIKSVKINNKPITNYKVRKGSFDLAPQTLTTKMQIEVEYIGQFNKEGMSFQRVVDPEDQSEYLYSDFEPYYAHGLFPCLDQPDLKAHFNVTVKGPEDWKVISNSLIDSTKTYGQFATVKFQQSKLISPYLFFLGTGPFTEWKDKLGDLPIYLYARKSLAKYVDVENLFNTTKKGLQFYNEYFGYPYPFPKFGLIFIPEFNWGGMENPGAIAFNEKNIYRGTVTEADRHHRDGLILHEMAHMWFGDLVTMQWWDDLWLNESFATYAASLAQERAMGFEGTWQEFFGEKTWAYWQDQLVTTHPIETNVIDVRTAKSNFDGITYGKGGSALKQLHFFVGEAGFRDGLRSYFKKYQFSNAVRANFISEISNASKLDLKNWTHAWLQTAGPNLVQVHWSCEKDKINTFSIRQDASTSKNLSPHRTRIGLFKSKDGKDLLQSKVQDATYSQKDTPVKELVGEECPDFVYPNMDDQDYALFSLDPLSLKVTKLALAKSTDPLLRLMIWNTLSQMVRDTKLKVSDFYDNTLFALESESNEALLANVLGKHGSLRNFYEHYLTPKQRVQLAPRLEALIWKRMTESKPGSSLQLSFFEFYVAIAQSEGALSKLQAWLDESNKNTIPEGITIDQDRRWDLIQRLSTNGFYSGPSAFTKLKEIINAEEKRDTSTAGKRNAFIARASLPELKNKKNLWEEFQTPEKIPPSTLRNAVRTFHSPDHPEQSEPFIEPFLKKVSSMDWTANDSFVGIYFGDLFPSYLCSKSLLNESTVALQRASNLTSISKRGWLEANDELGRCIRVRELEAQARPHRH